MIRVTFYFAVIFGSGRDVVCSYIRSKNIEVEIRRNIISTLETNSIIACVSSLIGQCHYPIRLSLVDQSTCHITIGLFENYPFILHFRIFIIFFFLKFRNLGLFYEDGDTWTP